MVVAAAAVVVVVIVREDHHDHVQVHVEAQKLGSSKIRKSKVFFYFSVRAWCVTARV